VSRLTNKIPENLPSDYNHRATHAAILQSNWVMRRSLLARAAAVSLAGHAVLALILSATERKPAVVPAPTPEPTEVTLLEIDDEASDASDAKDEDTESERATAAEPSAAVQTTGDRSPAPPVAIASAAPTVAAPSAAISTTGRDGLSPTTEPSRFSMRDPTKPPKRRTLEPTLPIIPPIAGPPEGVLPFKQITQPSRPPSDLKQQGRQFVTDGGTFVATSSPDGRVEIKDRPYVRIRL